MTVTQSHAAWLQRWLSMTGPLPDRAAEFAACIANRLYSRGLRVDSEVYVPRRGVTNGQRGRVDLVVTGDGYRIGIECDNKSPRAKSLHKLMQLDVDERVVILRRPCPLHTLSNGIVVFGLEVQPW